MRKATFARVVSSVTAAILIGPLLAVASPAAASEEGATITGKISGSVRADGLPFEGMAIAYRQSPSGGWVLESVDVAEADGSYAIRDLPAGKYRVELTDFFHETWGPNGKESGWREWWSDQFLASAATTLTLGATTTVSGVDADLDTLGGKRTLSTISGTQTTGGTVSVAGGAWPSGIRMAYAWTADGEFIEGATSRTLRVTTGLAGKRLGVRVKGEFAPGEFREQRIESDVKVTRSTVPTITAGASVGRKVSAKPGTWTSGTSFAYQWLSDGRAIARATAATYTPAASVRGKKLSVRVTGTKPGFAAVTLVSPSVTVKAGTLTAKTPTISGTASVGKKLTAKPGTWTSGTRLAYQWYASSKALKGATKSTLTLTKSHKGKTISVKVTGTKSGYTTVAKASAKTRAVR
ncbi:hypothetical protein BKA24_000824 [Microbacterium marinum]|uniref:Alpha-amylase n=1 Tax=Microbacterium marinum TaxID=421115 RepID=A0A7W7BNX8_9MICO|nr:hypothetical protein [Microbacterium marinum]MBB4666115.1 hypothetical protein [Microbacterium marinum]